MNNTKREIAKSLFYVTVTIYNKKVSRTLFLYIGKTMP